MVGLFGRVGQWVLGGMLTGVVGVGPVVAAPGGAVGGAPVVGGGKVAGAPVVGGAVLVKGDRRSWVDVAGDEAKRAHELEQKGLKGEAERARERVLHALVLAWREERAVEVLEPIVSTLHRRLGRSAAAVGVALRFIYEIHEVDALSELQQAQIVALQGQVVLALERLRREAKPRDGADCGLGFGGGGGGFGGAVGGGSGVGGAGCGGGGERGGVRGGGRE